MNIIIRLRLEIGSSRNNAHGTRDSAWGERFLKFELLPDTALE